MGKVVKLSSGKGKEERLKEILDNLEEVKNDLAELLEEYDKEENEKKPIVLTEALDALEDAHDIVNDVVTEEM